MPNAFSLEDTSAAARLALAYSSITMDTFSMTYPTLQFLWMHRGLPLLDTGACLQTSRLTGCNSACRP